VKKTYGCFLKVLVSFSITFWSLNSVSIFYDAVVLKILAQKVTAFLGFQLDEIMILSKISAKRGTTLTSNLRILKVILGILLSSGSLDLRLILTSLSPARHGQVQ